jgi:MFS family permease
MVTTFLAAQTIFTVFAPLYVVGIGVPVESLAIYYPAYGLIMMVSQIFSGRVSDRVGRGNATRIGCVIAAAGLSIAAFGGGLATFTVGAATYAIAGSLVIPTMSAMAMDRAPAGRLGSAMATYSIGYQFATGASSLAWGAIIASAGFAAALLSAIGFQFVTFLLTLKYARNS